MNPRKTFSAPFESPLEELFAQTLQPLLKKSVQLIPQYAIETLWGKFRIDFAIKNDDKIIGVECDGETVHGTEAQLYDTWRDIIILNENIITVIYRFSGTSLLKNIPAAVYAFYLCEPHIFAKRHISALQQNISQDLFQELKGKITNLDNFDLPVCEKDSEKTSLRIRKHSRITADQYQIYKFLMENTGKRINPLIYKYLKQKT